MKKNSILKFSLLIFLIGLFSCETEDTNNILSPQEFQSESYSQLLARIADCETRQEYVLYDVEYASEYGTVLVYNDNENLYVQITALPGWLVDRTYLYIGNEWPFYGEGDPGSQWFRDNLDPIPNYDVNIATITVPLSELDIIDNCFVIAMKVVVFNDKGETAGPRAFFDLGNGEYDFSGDNLFCFNECEGPGTGTPGYWKNHPNAWPVDEITICFGEEGESDDITYTKEEAIDIMKAKKVDGDKTYDMFKHLVSAKLNVLIGNPSSCIDDAISDAEAWMCENPVGSEVHADSDAWQMGGEDIKDMLDDYNNGRLCAPHRD